MLEYLIERKNSTKKLKNNRMIDIIRAEKAFQEYLKKYAEEDIKSKAKIKHTYGVMKASEYLTRALKLSSEDIELAKLIALLHDIGRFEQAKTNCKFYDEIEKNMNHAEFGVKVLFENNLIRDFIEDSSYDSIIYKAILNHNKLEIDFKSNFSEKELLHAKIIRDADKIDNMIVNQTRDFSIFLGIENDTIIENEVISDNTYKIFMSGKTIDLKYRETCLDRFVGCIAFIFDYNFNESIEYIQSKNCVNNLFDRVNFKNPQTIERIKVMKKFANEYIENRLKKE